MRAIQSLALTLFLGGSGWASATDSKLSSLHPEVRGDEICVETTCYASASRPADKAYMPEQVDLIATIARFKILAPNGQLDEVKTEQLTEIAPAYFMLPESRENLARDFKTIVVRNVGYRLDQTSKEGASETAFVATVDFERVSGGYGTVHVTGRLSQRNDTPTGPSETVEHYIAELANNFTFDEINFAANTQGLILSPEVMKTVIAPAIFGGYTVMPFLKGFVEMIEKTIERLNPKS